MKKAEDREKVVVAKNATTNEIDKKRRREKTIMSEVEEKILKTFEKMFVDMTTIEKEKTLSFAEGMAFMKKHEKEKEG